MLAKKNRFHRRRFVQYVYRKGKSFRGEYITLKVVRDQRHKDYRVGVVVSKKVDKSAVKRNRIRRRLYGLIKEYSLPNDADIIITAYDNKLAETPAEDIKERLEKLLTKANLI